MKTIRTIIIAASLTLLSAMGIMAAERNSGIGTRIDYFNSAGQRFWSTNINEHSSGISLFQLNKVDKGWKVVSSQTYGEDTYVDNVRFVPWGVESYGVELDTDIPTEYYVKSSNQQKPHRVQAKTGTNFNAKCGDTVVFIMDLPDNAYPSLDFLNRYTDILPDGEERWEHTTATPFKYYSTGPDFRNSLIFTQADKLEKNLSEFVNGSPSYSRLPDTDKCKNRWEYEFIMPNEPCEIRIGYGYADGKVLNNSVLVTLYKTLYSHFDNPDLNGNTGENWIMRYFGNGMSQEQINNLVLSTSKGITDLSVLKKANTLISAIPWANYYCGIILSNMILDNLDKFDRATETEKNNAKAQLLSFRAHCYTRILQIYGKRWQDSGNGAALCAPLILNSKDIQKSLSSMQDIIKQINGDLDKAIKTFEAVNLKHSDLLLPDLNVARGLKMRVALLAEDWITAKNVAQKILADVPLSTNDDILSGFYTRRDSWIWGASSNAGFNNFYTQLYYSSPQNFDSCNGAYSYTWGIGPCAIDRDLWLKISKKDIRRSLFAMPEMLDNATMKNLNNWYNAYYVSADELFFRLNNSKDKAAEVVANQYSTSRPNTNAFRYSSYDDYSYISIPFGAQLKFWGTGEVYGYDRRTPNDAATLFMRSDEALLTQAEACFMLGEESTARDLLNKLNTTRKCDATASSGHTLLEEIRFARRIELWGEGFGFFDQKRWNLPIKRNIWVAGDTNSGNWPDQALGENVATSVTVDAANGWRAPIPAYYVKQNPNIDIAKMGYTDVTGYTTDRSAPTATAHDNYRRSASKALQKSLDSSFIEE